MKILFLPSWYSHAGRPTCGVFFKEQALILKRRGIEVDLAFLEPRSVRQLSVRALAESHFQCVAGMEDGLYTLRKKGWNPWLNTTTGGRVWASLCVGMVERYVELKGAPDLIHAHSALWAGYAAYLVKRKLKVPYLVTEHSSELFHYPLKESARKAVVNAFFDAEAVLSVSERLADSLGSFMAGRPVVSVPNAVDAGFFTTPPEGMAPANFVLLVVASLDENKGVGSIIEAFAAAFSAAEEVSLVIVGDGPLRGELENLCERLSVRSRVRFLGQLSRDGVRRAMWEASALVLGSFRETFGLVLVEALATGIPVVATRSGGPEEIVAPEVGWLYQPGNVRELAGLLRALVAGPPLPREALRRYAVAKFGVETFGSKMEALYRSVLGNTTVNR